MTHPTFKDTQGREWIVSVAVPDIPVVREGCNVDLTEIDDIARVDRDPVLLVGVLWLLCERQAKPLNVSPEDFGRAFQGPVFDAANAALQKAIENFSPQRRRTLIQKVLQKQDALQTAALQKAEAVLDSDQLDRLTMQKMEEALTKSLESLSGTPSLNSQQLQASTSAAG